MELGDNSVKSGSSEREERMLQPMRWGLIPSWYHGDIGSIEYKMNNARSDGMLVKTSFKRPLQAGRRCVVLADGYCRHRRSYYCSIDQSPIAVNTVVFDTLNVFFRSDRIVCAELQVLLLICSCVDSVFTSICPKLHTAYAENETLD